MSSHEVMGGKVNLYKRGSVWHCSASLTKGRYRTSTKEESLAQAKQVAEDWYLTLVGKDRAGLLSTEKTFKKAAEQFLKEYEIITEGQRSPVWVKGHALRLRLHLLPFFGEMGLSQITAGKLQEYRMHRITTSKTGKAPARSTIHDEVVTLRQTLKTAIRHGWLQHLPDLSPPYKTQGKIVHRPWFSPAEYKQLYEATREYAREPTNDRFKWNAQQVHDFVLFMANTGLRGGLFSSALFLGCLLGQIFGILAGVIFSQTDGQLESFMLVGMGAVAASIVGAPITMVMLVLELTGNFPATTGVLLGVLVSSAITRYSFGYSFSTWRFHLRGLRIHSAQDIGWVGDITVAKLMFHDAKTVIATALLEQLRQIAPAGSAKRLFVMDAGDDYQGMIDVPAMHHPDLDKSVSVLTAQELAKGKEYYLLPGDDIQQALRRFEVSELEELPVLASLDDPRVIGYVSEAYVLRRYSQELESRNMAQSIAGSPVAGNN